MTKRTHHQHGRDGAVRSKLPQRRAHSPTACGSLALLVWATVTPQIYASLPDADGDGIVDTADNCLSVPNANQRDSNADGFGNACDLDLNNDGIVNAVDLGRLRDVFFTADADADANGDGQVNAVDLGLMRNAFFTSVGPGAGTVQYGQRIAEWRSVSSNPNSAASFERFEYDVEGRVIRWYTGSVDGSPLSVTFDYGWTYFPDGRLQTSSETINLFSDLWRTERDYVYDGQRVLQVNSTQFRASGTTYRRSDYVWINGALSQVNAYAGTAPDSLLLTSQTFRSYNNQGRVSLREIVPTDPNATFDTDRYEWSVAGELLERERIRTFNDELYSYQLEQYTHNNRALRTITGVDNDEQTTRRVFWNYDATGRLLVRETDSDGDGDIDLAEIAMWESGPCVPYADLRTRPWLNSDGRIDSGYSRWSWCHP